MNNLNTAATRIFTSQSYDYPESCNFISVVAQRFHITAKNEKSSPSPYLRVLQDTYVFIRATSRKRERYYGNITLYALCVSVPIYKVSIFIRYARAEPR